MPLITNPIILGQSPIDTQNFRLQAGNDGTLTLARKSDGSGGNILTVDANGIVTVTQGVNGLIAKTPVAIGYGAGAGGTVTQLTSKATAVTLNTPTGLITMNNAALGGNTSVLFQLNNTLITTADNIILSLVSGDAAGASYVYNIAGFVAGQCTIHVRNISAGARSEALGINFAIIKGATA